MWGGVQQVKVIKKQKLPVKKQISHGDINYSIENTVNNTVLTLYGDRWQADLSRGSFHSICKYRITTTYA